MNSTLPQISTFPSFYFRMFAWCQQLFKTHRFSDHSGINELLESEHNVSCKSAVGQKFVITILEYEDCCSIVPINPYNAFIMLLATQTQGHMVWPDELWHVIGCATFTNYTPAYLQNFSENHCQKADARKA